MKKKIIIITLIIIIAGIAGCLIWKKQQDDKFKAPGTTWQSDKEVEDYFVEKLKIDPANASLAANLGIDFRISKNSTLDAVIGNLTYYGLAKDRSALEYALKHTEDTVLGKEEALKVGERTIDVEASYNLSKNMTAWELADTLLNKPKYWDYDQYSYIFMPRKPE